MVMDMPDRIFYFTGTGNSLFIARRLSERFPDFRLTPVAAHAAEPRIDIGGAAVGFVFPAYYGGLPNIIRRFVKKLAFQGEPYIFCVVTAAYPWSCFALHQMKNLLGAKGRGLNAGFYVAMAENYIVKYDVPSREKREAIDLNCERTLAEILTAIENRRNHSVVETAFYALVPYPYFMSRLPRKDRHFHADGRCTGCGICEKVCPVGNIRLTEGRPRWNNRCECCMACISFCPPAAIQWKQVTVRRGRYHHESVSLKDMIRQRTGSGE
jgi:ferredoxin